MQIRLTSGPNQLWGGRVPMGSDMVEGQRGRLGLAWRCSPLDNLKPVNWNGPDLTPVIVRPVVRICRIVFLVFAVRFF